MKTTDGAVHTDDCDATSWPRFIPSSASDDKSLSPLDKACSLTALKHDESGRLSALARLDVLDTPPEEPFESIVALVQQVIRVPVCAISLVDKDRQWFKAKRGLAVAETAREVSFCTHTIKMTGPFIISDATKDPQFANNPLVTGGPKIRSYAGIPLTTADGYNVGSLCVIDTVTRTFSADEIAILVSFARLVVGELELRQIASADALTGALSRRAWFNLAEAEVLRAARYSRALSFFILDIDQFKAINDSFGHSAGDKVIKRVAQLAQMQLRRSDLFGRFGGEEFICALPETEAAYALKLAERIRMVISQERHDCLGGRNCTVSIGISNVAPGEMEIGPAFERADRALYQAKQAGRDRIQAAEPYTQKPSARLAT